MIYSLAGNGKFLGHSAPELFWAFDEDVLSYREFFAVWKLISVDDIGRNNKVCFSQSLPPNVPG